MIALGVLIFILATLLPGLAAVRLFGRTSFLYAVGLGLLFNIVVGILADSLFGMSQLSVVLIWFVCFGVLGASSYVWGKGSISINRQEALIMCGIYLIALGLQLQTTLVSPNLIGSDIHLEYYYSNLVLESGWHPHLQATTINACLGVTMLLPFYKLMTGMELIWVYKLLCPVVFAVLPLVLYQVFKTQFGLKIALLATAFFVTMPMFTMDMTQLIRQQQSELFFVLVVLLVLDETLGTWQKAVLGALFSVGVVVTHHGFAIGYVGYMLIGAVVAVVLVKLFRRRVSLKPVVLVAMVGVLSVGLFLAYYSWVAHGEILSYGTIPMRALERTAHEAQAGVKGDAKRPPTTIRNLTDDTKEVDAPLFMEKLPFLNPFWREPLLQTAIGLDFARASSLGKVWRVLQFVVEIVLLVGFAMFLWMYRRRVRAEYMAFAVTSFFVVAGMYLLSTYSYGMGATRVWQVSLIFMSPMFVIGATAIGKWLFHREWLVGSTLVVLIPYFVFNSGLVFEMAKMQPVGYIDVPYSVALSGHRVDIATVFSTEDVEAVGWLKEHTDEGVLYGDAHGAKLLIQKFGVLIDTGLVVGGNLQAGTVQSLEGMDEDDVGYIFLRKWNVDNRKITAQGEYGSRYSYDLNGIIAEKINSGEVVFDNGAKIILVTE